MATQQHHIVQAVKIERAKCRTDLLYLCNEILGYKDINRRIHGEILDALQRFPAGTDYWTPQGWKYTPSCATYNLTGNRKTLILVSRDFMKTSVASVAHSIQWILFDPNIRILMSTATATLATTILQQVKEHFISNVYLREIFPEYCPAIKKNGKVDEFGNAEQFTVPCRSNLTIKEPTMRIATVETKISGMHVDVSKNDDLVDRENARTPGGLQLVKDYYSFLDPIVDHYQIDRNDIKPEVIAEFGNHGWFDVIGTRYDFCLAGRTEILMSDWSRKPISEVKIGDEVIGWDSQSRLVPSKVLAKSSRIHKVVDVTTECGRTVRCTPEHRWFIFVGYKNAKGKKFYRPAELGRHMISVYNPPPKLNAEQLRDLDWLGGLTDGEGYIPQKGGRIEIVQSEIQNPEVCRMIEMVLDRLGFKYSISKNSKITGVNHYNLRGGRSTALRFLEARMAKQTRIPAALWGNGKTLSDHNQQNGNHKIVSIVPAGEEEVFSIQTETVNYVADGYASKNSDLYGGLEDADRIRASQDEKPLYTTVKRSALAKGRSAFDPDAEAFWPERMPLSELKKKESADLEMAFSQYYMNPIPSSSGLVESEKDIVFIPRKVIDDLLPRLRLHVTVDLHGMEPDAKGKDNDYTAMVLAGFGRDGRPYIVDIFHGRPDPFEVIETIFTWYARYPRIIDFKIQKDHFMRTLAPFLKREQEKRRVYPIIVPMPISNDRSKVQKIRGLRPWFRNGDIRFADDLKCRNSLINEIMRFPKYNHDDLLDAIADQLENREGGTESDVIPMERIPAHNIVEPKFYGFQAGTGTPMFSSNQDMWDDLTNTNDGRDVKTGY